MRFYYQIDGDSDGEVAGWDHIVVDEAGDQVCVVPDEETGKLFAAAPLLYEALVALLNRQAGREEWPEVVAAQRAVDAVRDGKDTLSPRDAESMGFADAYLHDARKTLSVFNPNDKTIMFAYEAGFQKGLKKHQIDNQ
jgi:hypothetical protein